MIGAQGITDLITLVRRRPLMMAQGFPSVPDQDFEPDDQRKLPVYRQLKRAWMLETNLSGSPLRSPAVF
jgi:hypothetical protein